MGYIVFLILCNLLVPALMIGCGWWMWKKPPKTINGFAGYRTSMSMKNADTWNFAQELSGRLMWKTGWIILLPSILVQLPFLRMGEDALAIFACVLSLLQCFAFIPPIAITEKALKRRFDSNGNRK